MTLTAPRARKLSVICLLLFAAGALYLSWIIARSFLTPILAAAILAIAIYPLHQDMKRYIKSPSASAWVTTLLVLVVVLGPTVLVVSHVANEITGLYGWLSERKTEEGGWTQYVTNLAERPLEWVSAKTGVSREQLRQTALDRIKNLGAALLQWAKSLVVNLGQTIFDLVTMMVTLFFLLRDGVRIRDRLGALIPIEPHRYQELVATISSAITANVYGVLVVAVVQGTLGAIGYAIAGLPSVMLWSVATALFSMIPLGGTALVWLVACVYLLAIGSWGKALFMLAWGAGLISTADNVVRPLVLSGRVKLNTLLIFFSLLGGVEAFGIIGIFLGPIVISVTIALLKMLEEERAEWEAGRNSLGVTER